MNNLSQEHRESITRSFRALDAGVSEHTFANCYLFRNRHRYTFHQERGITWLEGVSYDGRDYLLLADHPKTIGLEFLLELAGRCDHFYPVPESWLSWFPENSFHARYSEDDSDYIISVDQTSTFSGRKLHGKKNLLNQFHSSFSGSSCFLSSDDKVSAKLILDRWLEQSGQKKEDTDYEACAEAIIMADELGLTGRQFFAGEEPAGLIIGEELNADTFVIHFAKGDIRYKGIYQFMFNEMSHNVLDNYGYFNLEQDLGREELRKAKRSYHPVAMVKKYRVSLK